MNVLVVTQYFYPETVIINDLVSEMERQGHTVTILTGKPNYPDGKIFPGYRIFGIHNEVYGRQTQVLRVPLRPRARGGAMNLTLNYLSFVLSGSILGPWILRRRRFDVIFVFGVSPITVAFPAILFKLIKRVPMVLWVQDLWPQSLVVTKFVTNPYLLKIVEVMVKVIYKCCDIVLVQSKSFIDPIRKISKSVKLTYYPNSFKRMEAVKDLKLPEHALQVLQNHFSVVFAGNIGKAQSVETIVAAAKKIKDFRDIKIVFVGSGSMLSWIEDQKKSENLTNIECLGRFDIAYIPLLYDNAKALLLTLNADDILQFTLPWKTQSYMAAGKPIIGAIDGEGARVIREAQCGFVGPAENSDILAEHILQMYRSSDAERQSMGQRGLKYYEQNFEMETQTRNLMQIFQDLRSSR